MKKPPPAPVEPERKFQFVGGNLSLDFCNTVGGKRGVRPREFLRSYADLLSWARQGGLLENKRFETLLRKSTRAPQEAGKVFARSRALREAIYRMFLAFAEDRKPGAKDLDHVNKELAKGLSRLAVALDPDGFAWKWNQEIETLDQPLGPIAHAAAELLVCRESLGNIRQCRGENCGWLFLDHSKNHSRCWCDMRDCGNRAKVRRHRLRRKALNG